MTTKDQLLRYDRTLDCVHCGLCLPVCPTYRLHRKESASPRGRIYLMRSFSESRLEETRDSIREIDQCLVCRACETVCPSGVEFGEMMEITRDLVEESDARAPFPRWLKRMFFRNVLPFPRRLKLVATALAVYQRSGLPTLLEKSGILHLFGEDTVLRNALMPPVPSMDRRRDLSEVHPATGNPRARVGFLVGCVAQELLPDANRAAVTVLQRQGCEVVCPEQRPCCGALPMHFGDLDAARELARTTIRSFPDAMDAIVVSAAGCGSAMKDYPRLFEESDPWHLRATEFAAKVRDFTEFLIDLPWHPPTKPLPIKVTYDAPCHLVHAQRIVEPPLAILNALPGVELTPLRGQDDCCGAAGLASISSPGQSVKLLEGKMSAVRESGADVLVTANPGCQLQLGTGCREWCPEVEVLHLAELLERFDQHSHRQEIEQSS